MSLGTLTTKFAPAERFSQPEVAQHAERLLVISPLLPAVLHAVPDGLLVLNSARQTVFANRKMLELFGQTEAGLRGLRPGEAVDCSHAFDGLGCGTTEFCRTCGAVRAILASQATGQADTQECRVARRNGEALDLRVQATPLQAGSERFTIFVMTDISDEKRRRALERVFFHDILNTVTAMRASTDLLVRHGADDIAELTGMLRRLVARLSEEIVAQRQLLQAENNELTVQPAPVDGGDIVREIAQMYACHEVARGRSILIDVPAAGLRFVSDATLLRRVVGNMVKNALEASPAGESASIGCAPRDAGIEFWTHNPGVMPAEVRLQVFQRSFSTKGADRGLGTYSMKLLSERYLGGRVSFTTSLAEGTTFRAWYPLRLVRS